MDEQTKPQTKDQRLPLIAKQCLVDLGKGAKGLVLINAVIMLLLGLAVSGLHPALLLWLVVGTLLGTVGWWLVTIMAELSRNIVMRLIKVYMVFTFRMHLPQYVSDQVLQTHAIRIASINLGSEAKRAPLGWSLLAVVLWLVVYMVFIFALVALGGAISALTGVF